MQGDDDFIQYLVEKSKLKEEKRLHNKMDCLSTVLTYVF